MKFMINNQAQIANKYLRFARWKIRKLSGRFGELLYSEIYIKKNAGVPTEYQAIIKLGVPGPDIIVSSRSHDLKNLWATLSNKMKRRLANRRK